ncbi:hypothetical protein [Streptomyces sp. B27]|uniref:hypothetical protein n=1 Tax=Streptomyces sp. B27 TaxID=2485015 RepID=UPI000FDBC41C|nr:hypothetical protein [Streptomyces sp. B27]
MTTTPDTATPEQLALNLLTHNLATIYASGDPLENAVRLLADRRMLTSDAQRAAELEADRSAHRVFNHVPVARFNDEQKRAAQYVTALERVVTTLLGQLDAVTGLASVAKTAKGRKAIEQAQLAREFEERARAVYMAAATSSSQYQ